MVEVWLGAAALAVVAAVLLVLGARRRPRPAKTPESGVLLADRRRELDAEARVQGLGGEDVAALEQELALEFIDNGDAVRAVPRAAARPPLLPLLAGACVVAGLALGLYAMWGEPDAPVLAQATALMADDGSSPEALAELEAAIAARVARRPRDGDGWFYLGHLRMRSADYDGAVEAFAALHDLTGGNEQIDLTWAQAGFLAAGGVIDEATRRIVDRVLERRPEHPNMLELLAMDAIRRGTFENAAGFLDRALRQTLSASRRTLLDETLTLVRGRLDPTRPLIQVTVDVTGTPPAWLTVFARPEGARMPLAVVRRPARTTQTLILDDAVSMSAAAPLSAVDAVEVVARLSATGAAGDSLAEAVSKPLTPATQPAVSLTVASGAAASAAAKEGVALHVSTGATLDAAVPVFVIARQPGAAGPPVAVRRLTAGELPTRITLTDADAMLPGGTLSDMAAIEVVARASLGGSPSASSGDLESATVTTRPGAPPQTLRIEHVVP